LLPILPPVLKAWDTPSLKLYGFQLLTSPVVSFLGMYYFTDGIKYKLNNYARATMPRPDNPDNASFKLGPTDASGGSAPVLDYPKFQGSLRQELQKDMMSIVEGLTTLRQKFKNNLRGLFFRRRPTVDFPDIAFEDQTSQTALAPSDHMTNNPSSGVDEEDRAFDPREGPPLIVTVGSSTATPNSPLLTPTSSEEPDLGIGEQSNVRVRTRTGSTSTLHMDVEFNAPERGGPIVTSSFAASPRPAVVGTSLTPPAHSK
jgi:hypothetical protein